MNKTGIQYLDFTWNPVTGCTKGCPECWARYVSETRLAPMFQSKKIKAYGEEWDFFKKKMVSAETFAPTLHPKRLDQPARRKKPAVIGVCFMGDLFDPGLVGRGEVMKAILDAPQHTYILLTKQPEVMAAYFELQTPWEGDEEVDVYLGFSARTQAEFDAGWPHMAKLAAAGWKVWVSLEPMQDGIELFKPAATLKERWNKDGFGNASSVVVGAQSGKNAVPLNLDWARSIRHQCAEVSVPFMFKQGHDERGKVVSLPELDGMRHTAVAWELS